MSTDVSEILQRVVRLPEPERAELECELSRLREAQGPTPSDQHIQVTPGTRGGRPRIAGRRITVADIVLMHLRMGRTLEQIAGEYELPLASVHAAMTYYYDHQSEIDRSIGEDEALAEALRAKNPSLLASRLRDVNRA